MSKFEETSPLPKVSLQREPGLRAHRDALYSNEIDHETGSESVFEERFEPTVFDSGGFPTITNLDSVASGTFGHLVREVNSDTPEGKRLGRTDNKIRYNLLKVKPRRGHSGDPSEDWHRHQF